MADNKAGEVAGNIAGGLVGGGLIGMLDGPSPILDIVGSNIGSAIGGAIGGKLPGGKKRMAGQIDPRLLGQYTMNMPMASDMGIANLMSNPNVQGLGLVDPNQGNNLPFAKYLVNPNQGHNLPFAKY
tara:strand:- start:173 stop:553 length:381 start_codon:yes stop_codon:yes gene_type:complete